MQRHRGGAQVALGLGALGTLGALAVVAAAGLAYAVAQRKRRPGYSSEEWADALLAIGTIRDFEQIVDEIAERGLEPAIRADVWPFLLEVFDSQSSYQQRLQQHQLMVRQYQQLLLQCQSYEAVLKESMRPASPPPAQPGGPQQDGQQQQQQQHPQPLVQLPQHVRQFAEAHRVIVIDAVRTDFQKHAASVALADDDSSSSNAGAAATAYSSAASGPASYAASFAASTGMAAVASYVTNGLSSIQQTWLGSLLGGQAAVWGHQQQLWLSEAAQLVLESQGHMAAESKRQACRMIAMLSAYALHDPDTGYCQGMSDLLLPFLLLIEDDALAFWCFVSLMQRQGLRRNFAVDESGIFEQLRQLAQVLEEVDKPLMFRLHQLGAAECHFAYRMVVVVMRRDLPMNKVLQLWEVLWANAWQNGRVLPSLAAAVSKSDGGGSATDLTADARGQQGRGAKAASAASSWPGSCDGRQGVQVQLFVCFVAAVIICQRRAVIDHCYDADDVLRLFHGMKGVDVWQCIDKARELQQTLLASHSGGGIIS